MFTTRMTSVITGLLVLFALTGCASWERDKGVETLWRQPKHQQWSVGKTTDADVMDALGPPSQIIALEEQRVFYYMREENSGQAYIFILWNQSKEQTQYDRAVFFFDKKGILLKYAYSKEEKASHNDAQ